MHLALLVVVLLAIIVGPQIWAKRTLTQHAEPLEYLPGSGGELAAHLVKTLGLDGVTVEITPAGDHYDPIAKTIRLTEANFRGKSLTAVAVAAHETGHAIQDHEEYAPLKTRTSLVKIVQQMEKLGAMFMLAIPVVAGLTRSTSAGLLMFLFGLATLGLGALAHIVTLPVEWDASFGRALPVLIQGGYIGEDDEKTVRKILRACAFTYVASSLASLLNVWRWVAILRR